MLDNKMEIKEVKIKNLIFPDYNPRKKLTPDDKEYQKIKSSIEQFGYSDLVIINKDNTIISGNQRTQVMLDMGIETIKVVQLDIDKTKEKALNVALNKITGEWDFDLLEDLLNDLKDDDFDLTLTGFDDIELDNILNPVSFIDDLMSEEYAVVGVEKDTFDLTFNFENKYKDVILEYIKNNTRRPLEKIIIEEYGKDA